MTRIALLTEIPSPYRVPLFNALAERADLDVLFLHERDPRRSYRRHLDELHCRWRVLPGRELVVAGRWVVLNRGASRALRALRPDAVVAGGWNQPAFLQALAWSRRRRVPAALWVESTASDRRARRLDAARRALLHVPDAFLVPGRAARAYLDSLGVPPARIAVAPNAVDPAIFGRVARRAHEGPPRVLAVGRLAPEKGIDVLLEAARGLPVEVLVAGSGPDERRLRALAGPGTRFLGQVDRDELAAVYADADVLALPSRSEPWGMVLNEAALAGLPLVASDAAGAAHDLVADGENGYVVPAGRVEPLREAIARLAADPALRRWMGERSRELGARFTPEAWADAVARLCASLAAR